MTTLLATTAASGRPNTGAQASGNTAVVAAVVSVVTIAAIILVAVIGLVVILVVFRRKAKSSATAAAVLYTNDGLNELDNPMYSATVTGINKIFVITQLYSNKWTHFGGEKFDS